MYPKSSQEFFPIFKPMYKSFYGRFKSGEKVRSIRNYYHVKKYLNLQITHDQS